MRHKAGETQHQKTKHPRAAPGRRLRADVLLLIDAASAYSVRLFHHKVLHRDAVALDSLGIQYPVAAVFKKRARRDGSMGGQPVCAAAGFELVAEGRGNPLPLAVLVDGRSASAAEIFSAAVQDHGTGVIVGTQTYGKGVVQQTVDLGDGTSMKITIAEYYTPSGKSINGTGVTPDVEVEYEYDEDDPERDNQLEKAIEVVNG